MNDNKNHQHEQGTATIPIVEEYLDVQKTAVETGGVRVRKIVHEREETIDTPLAQETVGVERISINRLLDSPAQIRHEGETMIVPVMKEVLVTEKRLMLVEELHITKRRIVTNDKQVVTLRSEELVVEDFDAKRAG